MDSRESIDQGSIHRAVEDLAMAEMFLMQATLESAGAISEGISEVAHTLYWTEDDTRPVRDVLVRTRDEVVEAYASRFNYLRRLMDSDS